MRRPIQLVGFRRKNFWERSQDAEELLPCSQASTHAVVPACMSLWPSSMQTSGFKMFHSKAVAPKIGCPCRFPIHAPATQRPLIGRPASRQTRCTVLARPDTVSGALDVSLPSYRTTYTHNQLRLQLCRHGMPNLCIKTHAHNWKVGDDMGNAAVSLSTQFARDSSTMQLQPFSFRDGAASPGKSSLAGLSCTGQNRDLRDTSMSVAEAVCAWQL